jgi:hypothetical protein
MKTLLLLRTYVLLIKIDTILRFRSLQSIHSLVRHQTTIARRSCETPSVEAICQAIDLASALYIKPVLCLQRSATAAILLRRYGWNAEMCIGAQVLPFRSHAWVELNGQVVNDKPYMQEIYRVLERC